MVKINGFRNNYMARRAELFGIISSNPSWGRKYFHNGNLYCDIGFALHSVGISDEVLDNMWSDGEAQKIMKEKFGLKESTIRNIFLINDHSKDFETNVKACRTYLLGKNGKKAWDIVVKNAVNPSLAETCNPFLVK